MKMPKINRGGRLLLIIATTICVLLNIFPMHANAENDGISTYSSYTSSDWYTDWEYDLDSDGIWLRKYNGSQTTYTIPASATINGTRYTTMIGKNTNGDAKVDTGTIKYLSFSSGVKAGKFLTSTFSGSSNSNNKSLISIDARNLDVSNTIHFNMTFSSLTNLTSLNVSGWNMKSCYDLTGIFANCKTLKTIDISTWDLSGNFYFQQMFYNCSGLTTIKMPTIEYGQNNGAMSGVKKGNMGNMFTGCSSLTTLDLSNLNTDLANAMDSSDTQYYFHSFFKGCNKLQYLTLGKKSIFTNGYGDDSAFFPVIPTSSGQYTGRWAYKTADNHAETLNTIRDYDGSKPGLWTWETAEAKSHYVYLDANGGTFGSTSQYFKEVNEGSTYGTLPTPTKSGYDFAGWYTASTGGTYVGYDLSSKTMGSTDANYYAHWTAQAPTTYRLYLMGNNGTYSNGLSYTYKDLSEGSTYGSLETPTRSGYTFLYYTDTSENIVNSSTKMGSGTTYIYAQWKENVQEVKTHTVTFIGNGGTIDGYSYTTKTYTEGTYLSDMPTPTQSGYSFDGWYTTSDGGSKVTSSNTMGTNDMTLYAHWTKNKTVYAVYFDATDGGTVYGYRHYTKTVIEGNKIGDLPTPSKDGYTFVSWKDSSGNTLTANTVINSNISVTAQWKKNKSTYTVTFDPNGGTVNGSTSYSKSVEEGSTIGSFPTVIKSGYDFVSWTDESGNTVSSSTTVNKNMTLTAQWKAHETITTCNVTLDGNGGTVILGLKTYTVRGIQVGTSIGADLDSLQATWSGHTFDGWYTEKTGGTQFTSDSIVTGTMTLYAHWDGQDKIKTVNITFDANGGTIDGNSTKTIEMTVGEKLTELPEPTHDDKGFSGWYTAKDGSGEEVTADTVVPDTDTTYYATWNKVLAGKKRMINFDANGGTLDAPSSTTRDSGSLFGILSGNSTNAYSSVPETVGYGRYDFGNKITAAVKVKFESFDTRQVFFNNFGSGGGFGFGANKDTICFAVKLSSLSDKYVTCTIRNSLHAGTTYWIGGVYDGSANRLELYINGKKCENAVWTLDGGDETISSISGTIQPTPLPIALNARVNSDGAHIEAPLNGTIYKAGLWTDALSPDTIASMVDNDHINNDALLDLDYIPYKENNTFAGWYEDLDDESTKVASDTVISKDTTLHAKWIPDSFYYELTVPTSITLNKNGSQVENTIPVSAKISGRKWLDVSVTSANDYNLVGTAGNDKLPYNLSETSFEIDPQYGTESDEAEASKELMVTADDTLIADSYTDVVNFTVSKVDDTRTIVLDANGGTANNQSEIVYTVRNGSTYGTLPVPTKNGYSFVGWKDESGDTVYSGSTVLPTTEKLTAAWEQTLYVMVSGKINGVANDGLVNIATCDIYKNGELYSKGSDNPTWVPGVAGDKFTLNNFKIADGMKYVNCSEMDGYTANVKDGVLDSIDIVLSTANTVKGIVLNFESSSTLQQIINDNNAASVVFDADKPSGTVTSAGSLGGFATQADTYISDDTVHVYNPEGGSSSSSK